MANMKMNKASEQAFQAWVKAKVNKISVDNHVVNITHDEITQCQWPKMKMNFTATENVDLHKLKVGMMLKVALKKSSKGGYLITETSE